MPWSESSRVFCTFWLKVTASRDYEWALLEMFVEQPSRTVQASSSPGICAVWIYDVGPGRSLYTGSRRISSRLILVELSACKSIGMEKCQIHSPVKGSLINAN